jgi:hypothetical protein
MARRSFERFPLLKRFQRRTLKILLADSVAPAPDSFWTERERFVYARLKRALEKSVGGVGKRGPAVAAGAGIDSRPRLALVSPLPPERTGIADYTADLLPALSRHYDIVLITDQKKVDTAPIGIDAPVHDSAWLRANHTMIDRVIYQMGNSHFHDYMRDLMAEIRHSRPARRLSQWTFQLARKDRRIERRLDAGALSKPWLHRCA